MTALPAILAEIASVAGEEAALRIAAVRGGTQIYIPPAPTNDHWLCRLVGRDEAKAICEQLTCGVGPRRVDIPTGVHGAHQKVRDIVDAMLREDPPRSERDIALATGYTTRSVRRRRAKLDLRPSRPDDRQLTLF